MLFSAATGKDSFDGLVYDCAAYFCFSFALYLALI